MCIVDLLREQSIELGINLANKNEVIDELILLHEKAGNIADKEIYKNAIFTREEQGTTAIGQGIAVPHAKSEAVLKPALSAIVLQNGVDWQAPDGKDAVLLFMVAVPCDNKDLHLEILSRLMTLLINADFVNKLINAKTKKEFLQTIDEAEKESFHKREVENDKNLKQPKNKEGYKVLAVTACPTGVAHTYIAAEAISKAAEEMGISVKVETNGASGVKNLLSEEEIKNCDGIIVASDKKVEMARFDGKKVIETSISDGIKNPKELISKIINSNASIYHAIHLTEEELPQTKDTASHKMYRHLMNGVSHTLPFIVSGGVLIALAFLIDYFMGNLNAGENFGKTNSVAAVIYFMGKAALALMLPVFSGYISQSIADRPGLLPGMIGGYFSLSGATLAAPSGNERAVSGIIGALVAGFLAGITVNLLKKAFAWLPKSMNGVKPVFIYPLFSTLIIGTIMLSINPYVALVNTSLENAFANLGETSKILLSVVLATMMAADMGGSFNKAAYIFSTAAVINGDTWIMAAVMIGGMVPPIAIAIATTFFKNKWTKEELKNGPANYLMGLCFITEGAIPYAVSDPARVIPSCMVGSATAGLLTALFGCTCPAPHGGIFVFALSQKPHWYLLALVVGSFVGAFMLGILKKKRNEVI